MRTKNISIKLVIILSILVFSQTIIPQALEYLKMRAIQGGTKRNWDSYGSKINDHDLSEEQRNILADPQSGNPSYSH